MTVLFEQNEQISLKIFSAQSQRQIKQELGQKIYAALQSASNLPSEDCLNEIKTRLSAIQIECKTIGKSFIFIEERVTCNQYGLKGRNQDRATLFRGPSEDASVAICVTDKGSLLHRNGDRWLIYKDVGDVNPAIAHRAENTVTESIL